MSKHRATPVRDDDGTWLEEWHYRGWPINLRTSVSAGYHGRYWILGHGSFDTLKSAKAYVDRKMSTDQPAT